MKKKLLAILACPVCKTNPLQMEAKKEEEDEIWEGSLHCPHCGADYPIEFGIPNMIPPDRR